MDCLYLDNWKPFITNQVGNDSQRRGHGETWLTSRGYDADQLLQAKRKVEGANPAPSPPLRRILSRQEVSDLGAQPGSRGYTTYTLGAPGPSTREAGPEDKCPPCWFSSWTPPVF